MKTSRDRGGIKTVKGFKVSNSLFDKISEESLLYENGQDEFCREAMMQYFDEKPENFTETIGLAELQDLQLYELENRNATITAIVDLNTAWTLKQYAENSELKDGFVAGEVLHRFAKNGKISKMEVIPEAQTVNPQPPGNEAPQQLSKKENICEIDFDELLNPDVIKCLKTHGFDENRYYTPEKERETAEYYNQVLNEQIAERLVKEFPKAHLNNTDEIAKDFADFQKGTKILFDALLAGNGFFQIFTKYERWELLSVFPQKFHSLFL